MTPTIRSLRHSNESLYLILLVIFGLLFWLLLILGFIGAVAEGEGNIIGYYIAYGIGIPAFVIISAC
jgi:hypothetical protein